MTSAFKRWLPILCLAVRQPSYCSVAACILRLQIMLKTKNMPFCVVETVFITITNKFRSFTEEIVGCMGCLLFSVPANL